MKGLPVNGNREQSRNVKYDGLLFFSFIELQCLIAVIAISRGYVLYSIFYFVSARDKSC